MQKKIRKFVRFIVVVLFITICALIVNKTSELKIFGAREAYADSYVLGPGTNIQVDGEIYEFEVQPDDYAYVYVTISGLSSDEMMFAYIKAEACQEDGSDPKVIGDIHVNNSDERYVEVKGIIPGKSQTLRISLYDMNDNKVGTDAYVKITVVQEQQVDQESINIAGMTYTFEATELELTREDEDRVSLTTKVGDGIVIYVRPDEGNFVSRRATGVSFVGSNAEAFEQCTGGIEVSPEGSRSR